MLSVKVRPLAGLKQFKINAMMRSQTNLGVKTNRLATLNPFFQVSRHDQKGSYAHFFELRCGCFHVWYYQSKLMDGWQIVFFSKVTGKLVDRICKIFFIQ